MQKNKKFINVVWGYPKTFKFISLEENCILQPMKLASEMGLSPVIIFRGNPKIFYEDRNFDNNIEIIEYKNIIYFIYNLIKLSITKNNIFYVNSYEWQSFIVPFIARKTIFMAHGQQKRKTWVKQKIQNFIYNFFTIIRLNNDLEKEFLIKQGVKKDKLKIIPLIISQDTFKIKNNGDRNGAVYFGNVTKNKNLFTILKAIKIVVEKKPNFKLNIVGEIYDENFLEQIEELDLKKHVIIHGYKKQDDQLNNLLNEFLVCVNSSISEGQCISVYDAALSGCALCLPKILSFENVFKNTALFHDKFDYKQLAVNILYLLHNPKIAKDNVNKNIHLIENKYSETTINNAFKQIINELQKTS